MSEVAFNRLINGWSILDKIPRAVLLLGYSNTGRTTLAELIKKYYYKNCTAGLTYEGGKYNLQNIISAKSIKIQTTVPAVYEANNGKKEDVKILDVPSFCLSPDNKRWTNLDQKITAGFMFEKVQKIGFLLFLDEKNTKTNVAPLKKLLNSFLDFFNGDLSDQIENSIGIIITKSGDIKQDTMAKRLESMLKTLVKQKGITIEAERIFKKVFSNNRVFVMKKVNGQASEEEEIIDLAKRLETLPNCFIDKNRIKQSVWSAEEEKVIGDYVSQSGQLLQSLVETTKEVFSQASLTSQGIRQAKSKRKVDKNNNEISPNLVLKDLLEANDIKRINAFQIVANYISFKNAMKELTAQTLISRIQQILTSLIKLQIFFNDTEDLFIFQTIFETFSFIKAMNYRQVSFERHLQAINSLFNKEVAESILKLLPQAQSSNDSKQFYEKAIIFISTQQPIPASLQKFYERCQFKLIKYSNPKQAITQLFKMLKEQKDKNMVLQILLELASALKKADLIKEALFLFKLAKCPLQVIECYKDIINNDQTETKEYILYLTELYLFQQAKLACYSMAAKFGTGSRERFGELLRTVISEQKKYFSEAIRSNILLEDIEINVNALSQIEKAVNRVVSSI